MGKKFTCSDKDYKYTWPFALIQYYNENSSAKSINLDEISADDIFYGYSALTAREAEILLRYIRDGETLDRIAEKHNVTRARIAAIRDKALRIIVSRISKRRSEQRNKEALLDSMIAKYNGTKPGTPIFVDQLGLSIRATNCLRRAGIMTLEQLTKMNSHQLCRVRNLGKGSYNEIVEKLDELGIEHKFYLWAADLSESAFIKAVYKQEGMEI